MEGSIDGDIVVGEDGNEYAQFGTRLFKTRKVSDGEIFATSLVAGSVVDLIKVATLHPVDTARARTQWNRGRAKLLQTHRQEEKQIRADARQTLDSIPEADDAMRAAAEAARDAALQAMGERHAAELSSDKAPREGSVWAGLGPALATSAPCVGLYFGTSEVVGRYVREAVADPVTAALLVLAVGEAASWAARAPLDVIKLEQQTRPANASEQVGSGSAALIGLTTYPLALATDLPGLLLRLYLYRTWRYSQPGATLTVELGTYVLFSALVAAATTPLDVVRTRTLRRYFEATAANKGDGGPKPLLLPLSEWPSPVDVVQEVLREEGVRGLFAGAGARTLWNGGAIGFTLPLRRLGFTLLRDSIILGPLGQQVIR